MDRAGARRDRAGVGPAGPGPDRAGASKDRAGASKDRAGASKDRAGASSPVTFRSDDDRDDAGLLAMVLALVRGKPTRRRRPMTQIGLSRFSLMSRRCARRKHRGARAALRFGQRPRPQPHLLEVDPLSAASRARLHKHPR